MSVGKKNKRTPQGAEEGRTRVVLTSGGWVVWGMGKGEKGREGREGRPPFRNIRFQVESCGDRGEVWLVLSEAETVFLMESGLPEGSP